MVRNSEVPCSRSCDEPKPYLQLPHKEESNNPALPERITIGNSDRSEQVESSRHVVINSSRHVAIDFFQKILEF